MNKESDIESQEITFRIDDGLLNEHVGRVMSGYQLLSSNIKGICSYGLSLFGYLYCWKRDLSRLDLLPFCPLC